MADLVVITPNSVTVTLAGIGRLELTRSQWDAALRPIEAPELKPATATVAELVTAKALAHQPSLPLSCIYEYARDGRIPCVRAGKHVRFSPVAVLEALRVTDDVTGGRG